MKKKNWYQRFSLADDKYIAEANPDKMISKQTLKKIFTSIKVACACFFVVFCSLWLFLPNSTTPPDVSKYSDSEYYELIQNVNMLTFVPPEYKNNAEKLWAGLKSLSSDKGGFAGGDVSLSENMTQNSVNSYEEITDNQVEGIIEADRIKRSDKHIFYLDNEVLRVYSIDKENTAEVGSYAIYYEEGDNNYLHQWEFYLSNDCKTVTVVTQNYVKTDKKSTRYVNLISLDVSDPANITKKDEFSITGSYLSSRLVNGSILLLTEFVFDRQNVDFDDETTFIPQIDEGNGSHSIPASNIMSSAVLDNNCYVVVMMLDENTLNIKGSAAYLSYTNSVYVSENHVFLTNGFTDRNETDDDTYTTNSMTEISCLSYGGDVFETKGTVTLRGYVKDQWSMDEYEGILRVFTTTESATRKEQNHIYTIGTISTTIQSNASLYCIDLSSFEIVASVIDFAPPGEKIRSVRFDKETAYVCTSVELSDPVFFFNLSDPQNITYKDTGTIEGFSTSLVNLGNGYLLGIGRGDSWSSFKVEVYEETENGVRALCQYELNETYYSDNYKSYYIDRQNQLIGIGVLMDSSYNKYNIESRYILLHFDGYELVELVNVPLAGDSANKRGVYIDGYMYMFGHKKFVVKKIFN